LYLETFALGLGVLNLFVAKYQAGNASSLRALAAVNLGIVSVALVITAIFFHLPPLIFFGLAWVFFLASLMMARKVSM
jgi:fatty acid desaturase